MVTQPPPLQPQVSNVLDALTALEELQQELHRLGWQTRLHDGPYPFLRISLDTAYREYVFVAQLYRGPCYRWCNVAREHPLDDPAGAAERISSDLTQRAETLTLATRE